MARRLISKFGGGSGYQRIDTTENPENIRGICESRQVPGAKGVDRHYWEGKLLSHGFNPKDPMMGEILAEAKAAGIETAGKIYVGALARPGMGGSDPLAWVGGIDDMRTSARIQGKNLKGITNLKTFDENDVQPTEIPIAPDLLQELMQRELAKDPGWAKDLEGLREYIIKTYATPDYSTVE